MIMTIFCWWAQLLKFSGSAGLFMQYQAYFVEHQLEISGRSYQMESICWRQFFMINMSHTYYDNLDFLSFFFSSRDRIPEFLWGLAQTISLPLSSSKRPQPGLSASASRNSRVGESRLSTPFSPNVDTRDAIRVWLPPH
jgi:hypothetical protein